MALKEDKVQVTVMVDGKKAVNELGKLEMEAYELRQEMKGLKKNTEEYAAAADKMKQISVKMKEQREQIGLTGMTMRQLRSYQRELNSELDWGVTRGTQRYNELKAKLQEVNKVIDTQRAEVRGLNGVWNSISKEVKQFGILAAGYLGFDFITSQVGNIIKGNAKLSDSFADIRKTTGMTAEEVKELNSQLSKIDTRTANSALRDIAIVGGQIGIAKEDMLGFIEATDMAVVALGDEFTGGAEQVAKEIGSLQRLFKETKDLDPGEAINKIGSALNELGAAGSATSPEVAEFAKRMGPLGNLAPQISQTLGLGAAFQELGLTAERSSSGLSSILLVAAQGAGGFAALMGKTKEEVEKLINTNPNEFILQLADSFKGLSQTEAAQVMKELGITSQESIKVMGLLADKTDFVREKQELASEAMKEATSLQNENNVKQETFGALIDRISKKINSMVNNPAFVEFLQSAAENTYKLLVGLQKFLVVIKEIPGFIKAISPAILGLVVAYALWNKGQIAAYGWLIKEEIALKRKVIADRLATFSTTGLRTATAALNATMKANPILFVVGLVAILVGVFATLYTNSERVRGTVSGVWNVLKSLGSYVKDNLLGIFEGLSLVIEGIQDGFDVSKIKEGIGKALKSAFNLTGVGGMYNMAKDGGKSMASAFNEGYNEQMSKEQIARMKAGANVQAPAKAKNLHDGIALKLPEPVKSDTPKSTDQEDENQRKAREFLEQQERDKKAKKAAADAAKLRKQREKEAAEEAKRRLEMKRMLEDLETGLIQDSFEKRRRQANLNFEREIEDLKANKTHSIEIEKALELKRNAELEQIEKDQKAKQLADSLDKVAGDEKLSTEQVETEAMKKELEAKLQNSALLEIDAAYWKQTQLWDIERQGLEARLLLIDENDDKSIAQRQLMLERLAQLDEAGKQAALNHERARAQAELELQKQKYEAAAQVITNYGSIALDMMSLVGASGAEMAEFQKGLTLAQIFMDTAAAISSLTKSSSENPANGVTFGMAGVAQFTAGIARITANIAQAKKLLTSAKAPAAPSFFFGGGTGNAGMGYGDQYGEFAGFVHKKEYVIPDLVRRDPDVANYEAIIESKRTGLRSSRMQEEKAGKSGGSSSDQELIVLVKQLVGEQQASRQVMQNWNTKLRASVALTDLDEAEKTRDQIEEETTY